MATRSETTERKSRLAHDLRRAHASASEADRAMPLAQRELCARYELSAFTVSQLLRQLEAEGVLYTVPRRGTFLGRARAGRPAPYLLIRPETPPGSYVWSIQSGFETRLGQLGASSLALSPLEVQSHRERGELPAPAGVFEIAPSELGQGFRRDGLPAVAFESGAGHAAGPDGVDFDNFGGGSQAAHHLLRMGHRQIAFLGLHDGSANFGRFGFSAQREAGWQAAMTQAGQKVAGLAFHPPVNSEYGSDHQTTTAAQVAQQILARPQVSAVIAVNIFAARGLLLAWRASDRPVANWPAVVCFDTPATNDSVLSCLQLPWDMLGHEAAQLLWERKNGRLQGGPQYRLVPMQLIPRLTCQSDWAASPLAHSRAMSVLTDDRRAA